MNIILPAGMSEAALMEFKQSFNNFNEEDQELLTYLKKLDELQLLGQPYIFIKGENQGPKQIFIDRKEYEKIKNLTLEYLESNHKKVTLTLEVQTVEAILYSDCIISIEESNGVTPYGK